MKIFLALRPLISCYGEKLGHYHTWTQVLAQWSDGTTTDWEDHSEWVPGDHCPKSLMDNGPERVYGVIKNVSDRIYIELRTGTCRAKLETDFAEKIRAESD